MVLDLSKIKPASTKKTENFQKYLCNYCTPDSVLLEITDPAKLEYLQEGAKRFLCPTCGIVIDSDNPQIRKQEDIRPLVSSSYSDPNYNQKPAPVFAQIYDKDKNTMRSTMHAQYKESIPDPDPNFEQYLIQDKRGLYNPKKVSITSSKSGITIEREYTD